MPDDSGEWSLYTQLGAPKKAESVVTEPAFAMRADRHSIVSTDLLAAGAAIERGFKV